MYIVFFFYFFFQAEDGIRDHCVTGVQTCALPISDAGGTRRPARQPGPEGLRAGRLVPPASEWWCRAGRGRPAAGVGSCRSEERRVGKEWRDRWWRCTGEHRAACELDGERGET